MEWWCRFGDTTSSALFGDSLNLIDIADGIEVSLVGQRVRITVEGQNSDSNHRFRKGTTGIITREEMHQPTKMKIYNVMEDERLNEWWVYLHEMELI